ncbi:MAG: sulfite exporter TauE/SafE family protein [Chloroflexi bacterium]|nr:sulfite exporter TauE/SafE family protein [Chloroflexota bacterium]
MRSHSAALGSVVSKVWRLGVILLVGTGMWLGLRATASLTPPREPALTSFMADGGGGAIEVISVYAPAEYFRLVGRDPTKYGVDPKQELAFFVDANTHEHDIELPAIDTWWQDISLHVNGEGDYRPHKYKSVLTSEHHQTVLVAFEPTKETRDLIRRGETGVLSLSVPDVGDGARRVEWRLPLNSEAPQRRFPASFPLSLWAILPVLGGLLVAFSPCLVHMGSYYAPLFGGLRNESTGDRPPRSRTAWAAGLFALGFALPYSIAGVAVGYAGQFAKGSSLLGAFSQPIAIVSGAVVIYFGLQVAGVFRLPFLPNLRLPLLGTSSSGRGYLSAGFLGLNLAVGCLGCVGGSLFAGMLLYSGAVGSPLQGGVALFLFGLAANAPFFIAAMTMGRMQVRRLLPLSVTRHIPLVSGAILVTLGLLILSGMESVLEDAMIRVMGLS